MTSPLVYKHANIGAMVKNIGTKAMPWMKSNIGRYAPKVVGGAKVPFLANPHLAMPTVGAGIGAYSSLKSQSKAIQEGRQDKFSWGQLAGRAGIGAGIGAGASLIKPVGKLWNKGLSSKALSPEDSKAFLANNQTWYKHWGDGQRPKFLSKAYFGQLGQDLRHPLRGMKALGTNVTHKTKMVNGVPQVFRRSPVGMAAAGAFNVGVPASFMYNTIKDKDASPLEKAVRVGSSAYSYATPLMLPSILMWQAPDLLFKKKQQQQNQAYEPAPENV